MKNKFSCKTGDLLQSLVRLEISYTDSDFHRAEPGDLFLVYHDNYGECTLFSMKEQKYCLWEAETIQNNNYFCKIN
jgi:hypothetical protein